MKKILDYINNWFLRNFYPDFYNSRHYQFALKYPYTHDDIKLLYWNIKKLYWVRGKASMKDENLCVIYKVEEALKHAQFHRVSLNKAAQMCYSPRFSNIFLLLQRLTYSSTMKEVNDAWNSLNKLRSTLTYDQFEFGRKIIYMRTWGSF